MARDTTRYGLSPAGRAARAKMDQRRPFPFVGGTTVPGYERYKCRGLHGSMEYSDAKIRDGKTYCPYCNDRIVGLVPNDQDARIKDDAAGTVSSAQEQRAYRKIKRRGR